MVEIPIYVNQEQRGRLCVSREGLYTVLEAELEGEAAGPLRLWAHGEGKSACLGVPEPREGKLWLRRRLSRRELAAFPDPIRFVSDREGEETESLHNAEEEQASEPAPEETAETEQPPRETDERACPWPAEPRDEGLLWYARPDGTLVSFDGVSCLVAIPAKPGCAGKAAAERVIEGRNYLIFRY